MSVASEPATNVALVVDDDTTMRLLMRDVLEGLGFSVCECTDGAQALEAFASGGADMVLLDVEMPGMDGYTACARLREQAHNRFLPIVMVTGNDDPESVNRCYEAGATDFVSKPINWAVLGYRLKYILRTASLQTGLQRSEAMVSSMVRAIPDLIFTLDRDGVLHDIQRQLAGSRGMPCAHMAGATQCDNVRERVIDALRMRVPDPAQPCAAQEFALSFDCDAGKRWHYEARAVPDENGGALVIVRDVTERVINERKVYQAAYYDALTGLPNRSLFYEKLEHELARCARSGRKTAVMFLDLDRFKIVNDTLSHSVGDRLLQVIGERLTRCLRDCDIVSRRDAGGSGEDIARIGGDEFTVVLDSLADTESAAIVAQRIVQAVARPLEVDHHSLSVTTSVGIAMFPDDGLDAETLVKNADAAMYAAKQQGKNTYCFYSDEINARMHARIALEADLRAAIETDALALHYQPKVDSRTQKITGVEALLRWQHPQRGAVPPVEFVAAAEDAGLIGALGRWVLQRACTQMRSWRDAGLRDFHVAVNVSGHQLNEDDFVEVVRAVLDDTGLPASLLEIELTESVAMDNPEKIIDVLWRLRELGVRIALDDFGTGYSSLSYLTRFPIDVLKIDRSFVASMAVDANDEAVIKSVISMARALDLEVVAEGVETLEQFAYLRGLERCTLQGYLFSKPLAVGECEQLLRKAEFELPETLPHAKSSSRQSRVR